MMLSSTKKKLLRALILLTVCGISAFATAAQDRIGLVQHAGNTEHKTSADPLQPVEALLQKQRYAQAEEQLQSLMNEQAKNPQAWFDLGFAQSHQGKSKEAVTSYQKAVQLAPDWFEANLNLGLNLVDAGESPTAVPVLKHTVELKPSSGGQQALSRAWASLARALEQSDPQGSIAAYSKAAELNPSDADLLFHKGAVMRQTGDLAGAEQLFKKSAEGGSSRGLTALALLLADQHRYAEAAAWLKKRNPQDAMSLVQLAQMQMMAGQTDQAIATLEPLRGTPSWPQVAPQLASLYVEAKQYDKAVSTLQELLGQKGSLDARLRWTLGSALMHQHKYSEAEKEMTEALKANPRATEDPWELAYTAQQNQHYELALRVLDFRARQLKETPTTYWIRAVCYDSLGAVKPAAANYKLFLEADGGKLPDEEFKARHRLKALEH